MKTLSCAKLGGPCHEKLSAKSFEELFDVVKHHVTSTHPELIEEFLLMTKQQTAVMKAKALKKWKATPNDK